MKFKILLAGSLILFLGCKDAKESSAGLCPATLCAIPTQSFRLKFVDKNNVNADLIFGSYAKISLKDVTIHSIRHNKNLDFSVDSLDSANKYILFSTTGTDELSINLPKLSKDTLVVETAFVNSGCCGSLNITKLTLNNSTISFSNTSPTIILFKK